MVSSILPRGTIIIDTCALIDFTAPVEQCFYKEHSSQKIRNYYEILPFLAENGYHIIIPEIVLYEAASFIVQHDAHGKPQPCNINDYFPGAEHTKKFEQFFAGPARKFLEDVIKGKYPNIEVSTDGTPETKSFIDGMRTVANRYPIEIRRGNDQFAKMANHEMVKAQEVYKKDFGEKAINSITHRYMGDRLSTFLLSNDRMALKSFAENFPKAFLINSYGLIEAAAKHGLFAHLGLKDTLSGYRIRHSINQYLKSRYPSHGDDTPHIIDTNTIAFLNNHENNLPFSAFIGNLGKSLVRIEDREIMITASSAIPTKPSKMDAFIKKFPQYARPNMSGKGESRE